ncbi:MAG TPA: hypothetical protein VKY74_18640 [Chloroflexia bacterium]|nr:hypothetical protein [Chloroflexia bacterium]
MNRSRQALTHLEATGLIRQATDVPDLEYLFRHALVQDAATASLLKADRKRLHRVVGETLETLYPDRRDELAPRLARHFHEAADIRALDYYTRAGDQASRRYAQAEALAHYTAALELAPSAGAGAAQLRHLYLSRGRVLELSSAYDAALANYAALQAVAQAQGDRGLELAALMACATLRATPTPVYDPQQAAALAEAALAAARALADPAAEAQILWNLLLLASHTGRLQAAISYGEQARLLAAPFPDGTQLAYILNDLAIASWLAGRLPEAGALSQDARARWRALDNQPLLADNLSTGARAAYLAGNYAQALADADEGCRLSATIANPWTLGANYLVRGCVHRELGDLGAAAQDFTAAIALAEQAGLGFLLALVGAELATLYGSLQLLPASRELAATARAHLSALPPVYQGWPLGRLALLAVAQGDLAAAETTVEALYATAVPGEPSLLVQIFGPLTRGELALARGDYALTHALMVDYIAQIAAGGPHTYAPDAWYLQARAALAQGQVAAAVPALEQARSHAEQLGSHRILWQILGTLAASAAAAGQSGLANQARRAARLEIQYLLAHAGSPAFRTALRRLPAIRALQARDRGAGAPDSSTKATKRHEERDVD